MQVELAYQSIDCSDAPFTVQNIEVLGDNSSAYFIGPLQTVVQAFGPVSQASFASILDGNSNCSSGPLFNAGDVYRAIDTRIPMKWYNVDQLSTSIK